MASSANEPADAPPRAPRPYTHLHADLLAGLTVTLVGLPQCLAYAMMSGLPPAYGLSTAAVAGLVAALLGRSPHVVTGPTNTTGLLVLTALSPFLGPSGLLTADGLPALATLTLMVGLLRLGGAALGGAKLLRFIPESVLAGFMAGAGLLIGIMQLDEALGVRPFASSGLWGQIQGFRAGLVRGETPAGLDVLVAVTTVCVIQSGRRLAPRVPTALLTLLAASALGWYLEGRVSLQLVKHRAEVPLGWPAGALPSLDSNLWRQFALPALAIVFLGTLELTATARARGARPDMRREISAQGWANIAGALASAFPASASLTRSALLRLGGARTRMAAGAAAVFVVPLLLFGGRAVGYIPQAALAGVLFVTAASMVQRARLVRIARVRWSCRLELLVTFVATVTLPFEVAIGLGCVLAALLSGGLRGAARLVWTSSLRPARRPRHEPGKSRTEPAVVGIQGAMHYAAAPRAIDQIVRALPSSAHALTVDLSEARPLRLGALEGLEELQLILQERGVELSLDNVPRAFYGVLERTDSPLRSQVRQVLG